jgi:DNA-binding LacI/PurR family transcriptional regulator
MEKQGILTKVPGMGRIIAARTGISEYYVSKVLKGRVNVTGKKAVRVIEMADKLRSTISTL